MSYEYRCPICFDYHGKEYPMFVYPESKACGKCRNLHSISDIEGAEHTERKKFNKLILETYISKSNIIAWYKPDCEWCGQGAMLCRDPRCPGIMSDNEYNKKRERIRKRTWLQRLAARILNED